VEISQPNQIDGFQFFKTARRIIVSFEAMFWLKKCSGLSGRWTVSDQNDARAGLVA